MNGSFLWAIALTACGAARLTASAPMEARGTEPAPAAATAGPAPESPASGTAVYVVDPALDAKFRSGLPVSIRLRDDTRVVGTCRLQFDLWDEVFRIASSHGRSAYIQRDRALRSCLDDGSSLKPVTVEEVP